jgi:O-antigen ligase
MTDAFPHTRRPLPWILAVFLGIVILVPVDATTVNVHLPVNSNLDRFLVIVMVFLWFLLRGDERSVWRSRRSKAYVAAVALFWAVLVVGVLAGSGRIIRLNEWTLSEKQFALIASFFIVGWFALTALRPRDLRGFSTYLLGLGTLFALGMLIESRTGYNAFYEISRTILKPIATVGPTPTTLNGQLTDGRVIVVGSTGHGLAAASVLVSVMGFALIRIFDAPSRKSWWLNAFAFGLMASAAIATQKKTALVVLVAVILFVGFYRRRKFMRLLPLGIVLIAFMHVLAPGNIGTVLNPTLWFGNTSTTHRTNGISSIWPDVVAHPLLGRGYGSVNVDKPDQFRILDDQYLSILWQTGALGLLSYLWMIIAPIVGARRARRSRDPTIARTAIAASAGCLAFLVVNVLFDTFSYSQAPYMFFILAAFCVVASGAESPEGSPQRIRVTAPRAAVAA